MWAPLPRAVRPQARRTVAAIASRAFRKAPEFEALVQASEERERAQRDKAARHATDMIAHNRRARSPAATAGIDMTQLHIISMADPPFFHTRHVPSPPGLRRSRRSSSAGRIWMRSETHGIGPRGTRIQTPSHPARACGTRRASCGRTWMRNSP